MIASEEQQARGVSVGAKIIALARAETDRYAPAEVGPETYWANCGHMLLAAVFAASKEDEAVDRPYLMVGLGMAIGQFISQHSDMPGVGQGILAALQLGVDRGQAWNAAEHAPKGNA